MRTRLLALVVLSMVADCSRGRESTPPEQVTPSTPQSFAAGRLFVTNEQGGDISVVDVAGQRVVATIPVGKRPRGIRLSPDGTTLFVALSGSPIAPPGVDED